MPNSGGVGCEFTSESMEAFIRDYFAACNEGDAAGVASYFEPDGVHYFPPGMYEGPFRGARTIGDKWHTAVTQGGSYWVIDEMIFDPSTRRAVIEWSHFKRNAGVLLRGDEWYRFSERGFIQDIRAYYATPQAHGLTVHEIEGWDYEGLGYAMKAPEVSGR